ncbi:beta-N-acetylhexosaminidase [Vibrio sp. SM6]|uniref:Beta-hexosaminidase n=1 Tax=Vibrio agarilyticus TaxID=2726741 RepID=A0A7X8TNY0_9VIBR|nr:beta-N-acetylhexosaminidase [Vibrio agarilyticus]NLS12228.1 beta-N-acetylhexosaminidase [Vibrio agarilyticus]
MGPLWIDVEGCELSAEDKELLAHPTVGGLILFTRNFYDRQQLAALTAAIRQAAKRPILIGVDQEGGRVQRFRDGFSLIPAAAKYASAPNGVELAYQGGWLMAAELIAHDIDLSFAPVLDKGFDSRAIGNRAFGESFETIMTHSKAYLQGMKLVGMATTGKHFPGHGGVVTDTHHDVARDERHDILTQDMAIFRAHINQGNLDAMMPAHVIYPHFDPEPASGSRYWLHTVLREQLGFKGIVFSDDLTMNAAAIMGTPAERATQALAAGCDMLLMCNRRDAHIEVLDNLPISDVPQALALKKRQSFDWQTLSRSSQWRDARAALAPLLDS